MLKKTIKLFLLVSLIISCTVVNVMAFSSGPIEDKVVNINDYSAVWVAVNEDNSATAYDGFWYNLKSEGTFNGTERTAHHNSSVEFTFEGTAVKLIGTMTNRSGLAEVYIDGELDTTIDTYSGERKNQQVLYTKDSLKEGEHTIKVLVTGDKNKNSKSSYIAVDAFSYVPTLDKAIDLAELELKTAVIGKASVGEELQAYYSVDDVEVYGKEIVEAKDVNKQSGVSDVEKIKAISSINKAKKEFKNSLVEITFADLTGAGNDAKLAKGTPIWDSGKLGQAVRFNGKDQKLVVTHAKELCPTEELTVEAWIKADKWKDAIWKGTVIGKDASGAAGYILRAGIQSASLVATTSGWTEQKTKPVMEAGKWYHIAGVFNGNDKTIKVYINGELQATKKVKKDAFKFSDSDLIIGDSPAYPNRVFGGLIDEVRIWNVARSTEQIKGNYNQELSGTEEGLVGYWGFNELK